MIPKQRDHNSARCMGLFSKFLHPFKELDCVVTSMLADQHHIGPDSPDNAPVNDIPRLH